MKDMDLLHGPLLGKIFAFVLPLMVTNLLQNLYNAADMVIVSMSNVDGALGAVGSTTTLINLVNNLFMGLAVGASVMVARAIGERDQKKTSEAVHTAVLVGAFSGLFTLALGLLFSKAMIIMLGAQGSILDLAVIYTRIYFLGVPFVAVTTFLISVFRAKGDTRTPLIVLTICGLLNVLLNIFFVLALHMSVDGVALATAISNMASMVILACILHKDEGWCRLEFKKIRVARFALKGIVYNGLPAGIQGILFSISNMIILRSIIGINNVVCPGGSDIIDGNAAGSSIESFAYVAANSVCHAAVTFTSQHYGAHMVKRIRKVIRDCYFASFIIAEIVSLTILVLRDILARIYVSSPLAISTSNTRIIFMLSAYFTLAAMDTGSGIVRGLNKSILSAVVSLLGTCALRIIWIETAVRANPTLDMVYLSYPISWTVTGLCHFLVSMRITRKMKTLYAEET